MHCSQSVRWRRGQEPRCTIEKEGVGNKRTWRLNAIALRPRPPEGRRRVATLTEHSLPKALYSGERAAFALQSVSEADDGFAFSSKLLLFSVGRRSPGRRRRRAKAKTREGEEKKKGCQVLKKPFE